MSDRKIIQPASLDNPAAGNFVHMPLHAALTRVQLQVKDPGTDIVCGTQFYKPVVTLLAGLLGTRRQDLVYCTWAILGAAYLHYENAIRGITFYAVEQGHKAKFSLKQVLDDKLAREGHAATLWQVIDLLQSMGGWQLDGVIRWVRIVEDELRTKPHVVMTLQAQADAVRARHDREGMRDKEPALVEGLVVPVDGIGRVQ